MCQDGDAGQSSWNGCGAQSLAKTALTSQPDRDRQRLIIGRQLATELVAGLCIPATHPRAPQARDTRVYQDKGRTAAPTT